MSPIVVIASGKGGVGKTWLAISLSQALARQGRRLLLFDGDLGLANVDVQLGLGPGPDLASVLSGRYPIQLAVRQVDGGFDVLPRPLRLWSAGPGRWRGARAPARRAVRAG